MGSPAPSTNSEDVSDIYWGEEDWYEGESLSSDVQLPTIAQEILIGINQFREDDLFCDIVLKAGNKRISAHKVILGSCSPYFCRMFCGKFKEKDTNEIELHDVDENVLELIVTFIYTGKLELSKENVEEVLRLANFLQISSAEEACCEFLSDNIQTSNCFSLLRLANKYSLRTLRRVSCKCIAEHFYELYPTTDFDLLDFHDVHILIQEKEMCEYSDDIKFCAINRWINYSIEDRKEHLGILLSCVNFVQVSNELIKSSKLLKDNSFCQSWLTETEKVDKETASTDLFLYTFNRLEPRMCLVIDLRQKCKVNLHKPELIYESSVTSVGDGMIYINGGYIGDENKRSTFTKKTLCFNAYNSTWSNFIPSTVERIDHKSAFLNGCIYTIGGRKNIHAFNTVECLDLMQGKYIPAKPLKTPRAAFGLVPYEGCLYMMGGNDGNIHMSTIERFDPRLGEWEVLQNNSYSKGACQSTVVGDSIYCTFGPGETLERYDVKTGTWTFIKTLKNIYPDALFTCDNELFGLTPTKIVKYDPLTGKWERFLRHANDVNNKYSIVIPSKIGKDYSSL